MTYLRTADLLAVLNTPLFAPIRAHFAGPGRAVVAADAPPPYHRPPPVSEMPAREIRGTYRWSLLVQARARANRRIMILLYIIIPSYYY